MTKPIKSKNHAIKINKKRVVFPITQGDLQPVKSSPYFSTVVLDDALECHAFVDATRLTGVMDFTLSHMKIPKDFHFVPYSFTDGMLTLQKPVALVSEDMNTLMLLNLGIAPPLGHICANTTTGIHASHGSALCAYLARPSDEEDITLQKYSGKLVYPTDFNGNLKVETIDGDYYLIPLILSDKSTIYNAVLLFDKNNQVEKLSEAEFRNKLDSWLQILRSDANYWTRIGIDRPIFPVWDDGLEVNIVTNMFILDNDGQKQYLI